VGNLVEVLLKRSACRVPFGGSGVLHSRGGSSSLPWGLVSILGWRRRIDWEKGGMVEKESRREEGDTPIHCPRWFSLSKELSPNTMRLSWW
jgi:hypothetical protein